MKKIALVILLMIPFVINAEECNKEKHKEYINLSSNITYDNNYSKSSNSFTITIYNMFEGMYAKYDKKEYKPGKDNTIVIEKISGGEKLSIDIYGNDGCDSSVKRIIVNEPYYNKYYGTTICNGYENKLVMCSSQFTSVEVTKSILDKAIYNYNHNINQKTSKDKEPVVQEPTFLSKATEFLTNWGIKIALAIASTILSISLFSDKYRKVKHGI